MKPILIAATVLLTACSVLPKPVVETRYTLQPVLPAAGTQPATPMAADASRTLRISRPEVPLAYRGTQLVLVKNAEQTYYAGKAWEAPVPDLLQSALVRDLATAMPAWVISTENGGIRSAYELQTDVRTFATIQSAENIIVAIDLDIRLLNPATREVIKVLPFHFRQPLASLTTEQTLSAYQAAWNALLPQITQLLLTAK